MRAVNLTKNIELAHNVSVASSMLARMKGLLGRKELKKGDSLWIKPCKSVHTIGMKFPIDVLFLDSRKTVMEIKCQMPVYSITGVYVRASSVLELPAGTLQETNTQVGDRIEIA